MDKKLNPDKVVADNEKEMRKTWEEFSKDERFQRVLKALPPELQTTFKLSFEIGWTSGSLFSSSVFGETLDRIQGEYLELKKTVEDITGTKIS